MYLSFRELYLEICRILRWSHTQKSGKDTAKAIGFLPTIIAILLLLALIFGLKLGENGALFSSEKGPGSQHANLFISLICAIIIGAFMQRSKFCSVGAISKVFERDFSMFYGIVSIVLFASITNLVLNQYKFGFEAQFFVLGMGAGATISHNFVLASSGAGITPFAPYAIVTLISTLFTLNFSLKSLTKFGCFYRFLLINFKFKFLEKFSHQSG